ncbi:hypothetical protein P4O66_005554 [Electrophorus voltai]|uniref:Reverse transcriptase domain-containing protein n=1 Tax=Electrophorus voltai TaxID=2609070 RepID=A0AAD8ZKW5_9TELE|nr:hypothetical protein P4O66_005554 [Electrophorus voltai]
MSINKVLRELLGRSVITYIDDILIYSYSWGHHVRDIWAVLLTLLQNHLYCKLEKCEFHRREVSFQGYIIQEGSVRMRSCKVQAVTGWPRPQTRRELLRFLGFANFYGQFIKSFSTLAKPLTDLLRGQTKQIKWTTEAERPFRELKTAFSIVPVLQQLDPEKPFIVEVLEHCLNILQVLVPGGGIDQNVINVSDDRSSQVLPQNLVNVCLEYGWSHIQAIGQDQTPDLPPDPGMECAGQPLDPCMEHAGQPPDPGTLRDAQSTSGMLVPPDLPVLRKNISGQLSQLSDTLDWLYKRNATGWGENRIRSITADAVALLFMYGKDPVVECNGQSLDYGDAQAVSGMLWDAQATPGELRSPVQ